MDGFPGIGYALVAVIAVRIAVPFLSSLLPWAWVRGRLALSGNGGGRVSGHRGPRPTSFKGRAGRSEWARAIVLGAIAAACLSSLPDFGRILAIPVVAVMAATTVRRMHDLSWPTWIFAAVAALLAVAVLARGVFGLPPANQSIAANLPPLEIVVLAIEAAAGLSWMALLFFLAVAPGRDGPNPYGEADDD